MVLDVYTDAAFLDREACLQLRRAMDAGDAEDAEILHDTVQPRGDVRRALSIDAGEAATALIEARLDAERQTLAAFFGVPLLAREGAGFLRYQPGGFYKPHVDRAVVPSWPGAARRRVSVVVFLNGAPEFKGGVLRLDIGDRTLDVTPSEGLLVAFPADLLHEVTIVDGGTRDAVVDWFYDTP